MVRGGSIHTTEVGKRYKSREVVVKLLLFNPYKNVMRFVQLFFPLFR